MLATVSYSILTISSWHFSIYFASVSLYFIANYMHSSKCLINSLFCCSFTVDKYLPSSKKISSQSY